jgi:O-antigen ligase
MAEPTRVPGSLPAFFDKLALSSWRLLGLVALGILLPLALLFLVRGMRGALLGGVALFGSSFCLAAFSRPFWTLVLAFFVYFSSLDVYLPGPVAFGLISLVAARALFDILGGRKLDWGTSTFKVSTALLLAMALTSLVMARSMALAQGPLFHILWGLLFYVGISSYVQRSQQLRLLIVCMGIAFAANVAILLVRIVVSGNLLLILQPTAEQRVGVEDANVSSVIACSLLAPLVHVIGQGSLPRRLLLLPVVLLLVGSVILSVSRIGMGLLVLTLLVLSLRAQRARPFALLGLGALGIVLTSLPQKYWVRFTDLGQIGGILIDRSLRLRQHALEAGWEIFREHPWLGVGLGNFSSETPRYMSVPLWAHNTYLDVAATLGIFGFLAFVIWQISGLAMVSRAKRLWKIAGRDSDQSLAFSVGYSLLLLYVAALTLDLAFYPIIWILMGFSNAARLIAEADSD